MRPTARLTHGLIGTPSGKCGGLGAPSLAV
jgi:hypothetical protein